MLSGATRSPDAMRRKNTVVTLTALQECTERHRTVVGMCSVKVGSRCAKCFSDVLAAVQMDPMFSSPMAPLLRGRLKSPTKTIPPQPCFVLLFFCSCVCACATLLLVGEVVRCLRHLERTCLGSRSRAGGAVQWQLGLIHLVGAADQTHTVMPSTLGTAIFKFNLELAARNGSGQTTVRLK